MRAWLTMIGWLVGGLAVVLAYIWIWALCRASALRERAWQESLQAAGPAPGMAAAGDGPVAAPETRGCIGS